MNEEIKTIFTTPLVIDGKTIPVAHLRYRGNSNKFVTWSMLQEVPFFSANDELLYTKCSVDFDVYSDGDYNAISDQIKNRLKINGWTWIEDSVEMFEEDTNLFHRTITFEKEKYNG